MSIARRFAVSATALLMLCFASFCAPPNPAALDFDGDGTPDFRDAFPTDPAEDTDSDGDRVGDRADDLPMDPDETLDSDNDGIGNNADEDDDNDGVVDEEDDDPIDPNVPVVTRPDLVPNESDSSGDDEMTTDEPDEGDFDLTLPDNPLAGAVGEPVSTIAETQLSAFDSGKAIFETEYLPSQGLSDDAFGNSCASCHQNPVSGGGGTVVDAVIVTETLNVNTARNVQPLFGIGLIERISAEEILSRQDAADNDTDGISGRANTDGQQLGRYGRKAQVASLESIVRGMLQNQMGMSSDALDMSTGKSISRIHSQVRFPVDTGSSADGDDIEDPEVPDTDLADLISFVANLGAPQRATPTAAVARGEAVFERIGCAACHIPSMPTEDGFVIYPYSDFLLHDMGDNNGDFLRVGTASSSEFRTQPLWGLSQYDRYLHNGSATTIEEAILAHDGEAEGARLGYQLSSPEDRADLLAFMESL